MPDVIEIQGLGSMGVSKKAQSYIKRKIKKLYDEGYRGRQAVAIAFNMARKKGYKVPRV